MEVTLVAMDATGKFHRAAHLALIAGLAPIAWDGGQSSSARHIKGGRAHVRRALYMAAVSAARCNPALKAFLRPPPLQRQKAQSRPHRRMRKLVILATTLVGENRT
jgi:transposase